MITTCPNCDIVLKPMNGNVLGCPNCGFVADPGGAKIEQMFAFIAVDADGNEGIPAISLPGGLIAPMVGADLDRMRQFAPHAEKMRRAGGTIKLAVFWNRREIDFSGI